MLGNRVARDNRGAAVVLVVWVGWGGRRAGGRLGGRHVGGGRWAVGRRMSRMVA